MCDIVGFTCGYNELQNKTLESLKRIARQSIQIERKGNISRGEEHIFIPTGDGFAVAFLAHPIQAFQFAIKVAKAIANHNRPLNDQHRIRMRAGLNVGPVLETTDLNAQRGIVGGGINQAQRIMDCGAASHILASQTVILQPH